MMRAKPIMELIRVIKVQMIHKALSPQPQYNKITQNPFSLKPENTPTKYYRLPIASSSIFLH